MSSFPANAARRGRIALAARPKVEPSIVCPIGNIAPQHLGQFFFDQINGVFYRARGLTAMDWHLVTPSELTRSFIRSFVDFLEPRHHAQKLSEDEIAAERNVAEERAKRPEKTPHIVDEVKAGEVGLRVSDARVWTTAAGTRVMQARVRVEARTKVAVFAGFCFGPVSPVLPVAHAFDETTTTINDPFAVGFLFDDTSVSTLVTIASNQPVEVTSRSLRDDYVPLRVELALPGRVALWADDELVAEREALGLNLDVGPRVAMFDYGVPL